MYIYRDPGCGFASSWDGNGKASGVSCSFLVFDIHLRSADCLDQQQKMEDLMSYVFFNIKGFI